MPIVRPDFTRRRRRGMVAAQVALCLTALVGVAALAVDGGLLIAERRRAQAVADAAALAGAIDLFKNYPTNAGADSGGTARTNALAVAADNLYANDGTTSTVSVNIPPATARTAYFNGKAGYVEVNVTYNMKRGLSGIWGSARIPVSAHAVAQGRWAPGGQGIITLDPTAGPSLNAGGNGSVTVNGGSIQVNSNDGSALTTKGGGGIAASSINVVGGYSGGGYTPAPNTGAAAVEDPLKPLPEPARPASAPTPVYNSSAGTWTLSPGSYDGAGDPAMPSFKKGDTVIFNQATTNSAGGIYYLNNGFSLKNIGIQMGSGTGGIMLFMAAGSLSGNGNGGGTIALRGLDGSVASTSIYKGLLYFQSRSDTQNVTITGNAGATYNGTFYAPTAKIDTAGSGNITASQFIADTINLQGNGSLTLNYSGGINAPNRSVSLVE